jgi:hypothetical protein
MTTSASNAKLAQENAALKDTVASLQAASLTATQEQAELKDTVRTLLQQINILTTRITALESIAGSYRSDSNASWNEPTQAAQAAPVDNNYTTTTTNNNNNNSNDPKLDFCKLNLLVTVPIQQLRTFNGPLFIDAVNRAIQQKLQDPNTTSFKENLQPENITLVQRVESRSNDKAAFRVRLSDARLKYTVFWIKAILRHWSDLAWIISEELTPLQKQAQQQKWGTLPSELRSHGVVTWFQGLDLWCRPPTAAGKVQILSQEDARSIIETATVAQAHSAGASQLGQRPASPSGADPSPAAKRTHAPASEPAHNPDTHPHVPVDTHMPTSPTHHTHMTE